MLKAVLFDIDDTLIDWGDFFDNWEEIERANVQGVHQYLTSLVDSPPDFPTYHQEYVTRTRSAWNNARTTLVAPHVGRVLVEAAVMVGIPENRLDVDAVMDHYNWGAVPGTSVFPDVIEGLNLLQQRGLKLGLVTNAYQPMRLRDIEMDRHGLLGFFPCCRFSAADVGYLKPHLTIFERALNCIGVEPEETVFVGDNPTADIGGAQAAGMKAVLREVPHRKMQMNTPIVPDATIQALTELPQIFDEWFPGWDLANGH